MYSYKRVFKGKLQGCIFDWSEHLLINIQLLQ